MLLTNEYMNCLIKNSLSSTVYLVLPMKSLALLNLELILKGALLGYTRNVRRKKIYSVSLMNYRNNCQKR